MAGLSDDQLKAIVDQELRSSIGYGVGKLANQRQRALVYYEGLAKLDLSPPEIEGRSTVVSTDVRNVIQSVLPVLMAKFASGEDIVEAVAKRMDKEPGAKQVSDYMNHVFYEKCNGHKILETAILDTLISKVGIIKCWWDDRTEETRETYKGLDDFELAQLADDEEVEIVSHTSYVDEEDQEQRKKAIEQLTQQLQGATQAAQQGDQNAAQAVQQMQQQIASINQTPPKMLHDVDCKRSKKGGKINLENIPPEEFRISRKARSIKDAPMVGHAVRRTVSELKSMGYKNVDAIGSDPSAQVYSGEAVERQVYDDEQPYYNDDQTSIDDSMRIVWVNEVYLRADRDGDGIAELLKVTKAGDTLLDVEVVDVAPFIDLHAITLPYRFFGMSLADMAMEPQRINTMILRSVLDNLSLQVNGRYFAVNGQVNLDDLMTSRPGGIVRVNQPGAVGRLDQAQADTGTAMEMLQYLRGFTEEATGWQRTANAVDNLDSLNTTATSANIQSNKAQMRVDLMARNIAEGVTELFRMMLKLVCQHQDTVEEVRVNGQWQPINPREWANAYDFHINVGLGTGSKEQQVQHLNLMMQHQGAGMQIGIATPENLYQSAKKMTEALGYKNADAFWTDPAKQPPKPPQPSPEMVKAQAQMQIEQMKAQTQAQTDAQSKQAELALERERMQMQAQVDTHRQQVEAQQQQIRMQQERELAQFKAQLDAERDRQKAELQAQTQMAIAKLQAETELLKAEITAKTLVTKQQDDAADAAIADEASE